MLPEKGAKLMMIAKSFLGCHYINGSYGAIPGVVGSGSPTRSNNDINSPEFLSLINDHNRLDPTLDITNPRKNLAVSAAQMKVKEYCVCAGSWESFSGGRRTDANAWDLNFYLNTLRSQPDKNLWIPYFQHFTPRRAFGQGEKGNLAWGQSCAGIRHFDCITFINYCLWQLTGIKYSFEIIQWRDNPTMTGAKVFDLSAVGSSFKIEDGDILIKMKPGEHQHIAFVSKDKQVVEAKDTKNGVVASKIGEYKPTSWTHLARVS